MKIIMFLMIVFFSPTAFSADWKMLNGIYAVTSKGYAGTKDSKQNNSHYKIQLKGHSARDLYKAMDIKPVTDECTGGLAKNIGDMQCMFFKQNSHYECHFSIDISGQKIEYGVAC